LPPQCPPCTTHARFFSTLRPPPPPPLLPYTTLFRSPRAHHRRCEVGPGAVRPLGPVGEREHRNDRREVHGRDERQRARQRPRVRRRRVLDLPPDRRLIVPARVVPDALRDAEP